MTDQLERTISMERAEGGQLGSFGMVLATEGEASDGHILRVAGAEHPDRVPLLFGHTSSPEIPALGHVTDFTKGRKDGKAVLRARGQINLEGGPEDGLLPVRQGIANLIDAGDLSAVSVRWDDIESIPRSGLKNTDPAFVAAESDTPGRWGRLFKKWRVREGSVVALGADLGATIGRADPVTADWLRENMEPGTPELIETAREALQAALDGGWSAVDVLADIEGEFLSDAIQSVTTSDGRQAFIPRSVYDVLTQEAVRGYADACEILKDANARQVEAADVLSRIVALAPQPVVPVLPRRDTVAAMRPEQFVAAVRQSMETVVRDLTTGRVR